MPNKKHARLLGAFVPNLLRANFCFALIFIVAMSGCSFAPKQTEIGTAANEQSPRLAPLQNHEWTPEMRKALAPVSRDGKTFNVFAVAAHNPKLLSAWNHLGLYLLRHSSLPARDREILILKTAVLASSEYEFSQHAVIGKQAGLMPDEIDAIANNTMYENWSALEVHLLTAAVELNTLNTLSDETWAALSEHYNTQQLLDLIATVGQYRSLAMFLNALRVPLDEQIPRIELQKQATD